MIHGIYIKNKPKSKWHLFSITMSAEAALQNLDDAKQQAKLEGYDHAEVAIQLFDSSFHIPEYISEIKNQKPMFN